MNLFCKGVSPNSSFCLTAALFVCCVFNAACSRGAASTSTAPAPAKAKLKVQLAEVEQRPHQRMVEAVGSLFAHDEVTVSSEAEGRVEEVFFDVGDRVSKGQALARISPVEMQLTVEQQKAGLAQARARLGLRGDEAELRDVNQAAEVKKAAADLADAEQRYRRAASLLETGVIPRQQYDEAEARFQAARATHSLAIQQVENLRAAMQQNQASLNLASKRLRDAQIRAPFSGHIKARLVTVGQFLKVQTPVMELVNVDPLRVRLNVPEKMTPWVKVGRTVTLTMEAFPGREFSARVTRINPTVDEKTRTFEIEGAVANPRNELKPGSFVKAVIPSDKTDSILTIPEKAAVYLFGAYKVFVVENGKLKEREIRPGDRFGDRLEIIEGLKPGEKIALSESGQALKDGVEIEISQ
ncbi:MAG: efflux RND transporter periplasmic adaptor subunit [Blastocatellia bacterium]